MKTGSILDSPAKSPTALRQDGKILEERALHPGPLPEGVKAADGNEILRYICYEMSVNSSLKNEDFAYIRKKLEAVADPELRFHQKVAYLFEAMEKFSSKVGYGNPWDQKKYIRSRWGKHSRLYGVLVDYDVWSNVHYGFVGLKAFFPKSILLDCAGIAQASWSKVPAGWFENFLLGKSSVFASLDDPRDQEAIKLGFDVAENFVDPLDSIADVSKFFKKNMVRILSDTIDSATAAAAGSTTG